MVASSFCVAGRVLYLFRSLTYDFAIFSIAFRIFVIFRALIRTLWLSIWDYPSPPSGGFKFALFYLSRGFHDANLDIIPISVLDVEYTRHEVSIFRRSENSTIYWISIPNSIHDLEVISFVQLLLPLRWVHISESKCVVKDRHLILGRYRFG